MKKQRKLGRIGAIAGIDIYLHWSFLLLLGWILLSHLTQGHGLTVALEGTAFILAIFGCVVLHELGHALAARRFGIRTRDITLYPIGGVARLEEIPQKPAQELWVALAGPAVNVAIALGLLLVLTPLGGLAPVAELQIVGGDFWSKVMVVNVVLAVFNLVPAFPMDGGRVLRALLAMKLDYVDATRYAARVGQGFAIVLGFLGLFTNWFLLFIAFFVFVGAQHEAQAVETRSMLAGIPVRAAMMTQFKSLDVREPLKNGIDALLAGAQQDFPVVDHGQLVGLLRRERILEALQTGPKNAAVADVMTRTEEAVDEREMLDSAFARMRRDERATLPVIRDDEITGLLTLENIGEWLMVQASLNGRADRR
jgi:Zn-dependent protease